MLFTPSKRLTLIAMVIVVAALGLRLPGLGSFMTVDEENWTIRSAAFWHSLFRHGDLGGTFLTTHPGATAMWLIGSGVFLQEARTGIDADTSTMALFRLPATLPIAIVTAILIGIATWFVGRIWGTQAAAISGILLASEPYLLGLSQIAHLDALLALLMLNAVLALLAGQAEERRMQSRQIKFYLFVGVFTGLALGTKLLPALWLLVFFGLFLVWHYRWRARAIVSRFGFVAGTAALVFYALWPALWVKADAAHSIQRDTASVVTDEHVAQDGQDDLLGTRGYYGRTLIGRTTPYVLILAIGGLIAGAVSSIRYQVVRMGKRAGPIPNTYYSILTTTLWLFLYALGFLVLITLAAKKGDRYALPALAVLPIVAGGVLQTGLRIGEYFFAEKWGKLRARRIRYGLVGLVMIGAATQSFLLAPYAIAYVNPWWGEVVPLTQQGWGEGLEQAAAYLNQHPLADRLYVASWYPSVFQTYFKGKTFSLSSRDDARTGFLVTYRNMYDRPDSIAGDVLDEVQGQTPEYVVSIQGVPYAMVYNTLGIRYFDRNAGEIFGEMEVGQTVSVTHKKWQGVEIGMATFSGRVKAGEVVLHVRESADSSDDIRTVRAQVSEIQDSAYHRFEFEPIENSEGKMYYVAITSPASQAGDAATVKFVAEDVLPGDMYLRRESLMPGKNQSQYLRQGWDIAYRLIQE